MVNKSPKAYRNISEVAELVNLKPHVLRFWESKFTALSPMTRGGGRRYYSPDDIAIIEAIKELHYERGLTIRAANKILDQYGRDAMAYAQTIRPETNMEVVKAPGSEEKLSSSVIESLRDYDRELAKIEDHTLNAIARLDKMIKNIQTLSA